MMFGALLWQKRIRVYSTKPQVPGIRLQHRFVLDMGTGILESLEIVLLFVGECQRDDFSGLKADKQLRL